MAINNSLSAETTEEADSHEVLEFNAKLYPQLPKICGQTTVATSEGNPKAVCGCSQAYIIDDTTNILLQLTTRT